MVEVQVCVGSSCHMKGSYQVIKTFTELIKQNDLKDVVSLKASFCMGHCLNGIAVRVDGQDIGVILRHNVENLRQKPRFVLNLKNEGQGLSFYIVPKRKNIIFYITGA